MKKKLNEMVLISVALMFLLLTPLKVYAEGGLIVQLLKYEPVPVEPGQSFELWVSLENTRNDQIQNATVRIDDSYPFYLEPGEDREQSFSLPAKSEAIASFKMRVADDVPEGDRPITIKFSATGEGFVEREYYISIQSHQNLIAITDVETSPENVFPGDIIDVSLTLTNLGSSFIKDISVALELVSATSTGVIELPFTPNKDNAVKMISMIGPKETAEISFSLKVDQNAAISSYKIPITFQYYDEQGNMKTAKDMIGIALSDRNDVEILLDSENSMTPMKENEISFKIVNKGFNEIKFSTVEITETTQFDVISSNRDYIGNINSDDYEIADFTIVPKATEGYVSIPVKVTYLDYANKEREIEQNFEIRIFNQAELNNGSNLGIWIILVVLAVVLVIYFRRRNAKKEAD